jgi:two-component system response regulator YesN
MQLDIPVILVSNFFVPVTAGLFFFLFFIYFMVVRPQETPIHRHFTAFLLSFAIFLLTRPIQILAGPHPWPLFINNIRLLVLSSICAPMLVFSTGLMGGREGLSRKLIVYGAGLAMGLLYAFFNFMGTTESYELLRIGDFIAYDNLTPSMNAPWFPREVTQAIQVFLGIILAASATVGIARAKTKTALQQVFRNKLLLINLGVIIFGVAFVAGTIWKQWSIYYGCSVLSAVLIGAGVINDIKELYMQNEAIVSFIKDDVMRSISFTDAGASTVSDRLSLLGKMNGLDTLVEVNISFDNPRVSGLRVREKMAAVVRKELANRIGYDNFILFPFAADGLGIALCVSCLPGGQDDGERLLLDLIGGLKPKMESGFKAETTIGIGRTYPELHFLRYSYYEALAALEFGLKIDEHSIIHVNNIKEPGEPAAHYPYKAKENLLFNIRLGDSENAAASLGEFLAAFREFTKGNPRIIKVRMYEFIGSIIDAAIAGGGDVDELHRFDLGYFNDINNLKDFNQTQTWITKVVAEITASVAKAHGDRATMIVGRAKLFVENNFSAPITVEDVAKEVIVSPSYFLHLFKAKTGSTLGEYVQQVRLQKAKELLLKSDHTIIMIANDVGYADSNYFSTVFKAAFGMTPSEYRKRKDGVPASVSSGTIP